MASKQLTRISPSSGGWRSETRARADWVSGEGCPVRRRPLLTVLTWQRAKGALWGPFQKGTNPIHGVPPHELIPSLEAPLLTLGS